MSLSTQISSKTLAGVLIIKEILKGVCIVGLGTAILHIQIFQNPFVRQCSLNYVGILNGEHSLIEGGSEDLGANCLWAGDEEHLRTQGLGAPLLCSPTCKEQRKINPFHKDQIRKPRKLTVLPLACKAEVRVCGQVMRDNAMTPASRGAPML